MQNDVIVSHAGKQHSYKLAYALQEIGRLNRFVTSTYYFPSKFPDRLFAKYKKSDEFFKKRFDPGLTGNISRYCFLEIPEIVLRKVIKDAKFNCGMVSVRDAFYDYLVSKRNMQGCSIFWGFQGSALRCMNVAKRRGIKAVVELSIGHVASAVRILEEEKLRNPEWADSINNLYFPSWYLKRLEQEPKSADVCVVASSFTRKTLTQAGCDQSKIKLLPLGVDVSQFTYAQKKADKKFNILFVGSVGQRKGIKYLLDAYQRMKGETTTLTIIGPIVGSGKAFKERSNLYNYLGPLNQFEIIKHMQQADCLVLPSLFEGFGLVIVEAMASGLPVITTTHTAGPDIISDGVDGFVLNPLDVTGLAHKLTELAQNHKKVLEMGRNAYERSMGYSWSRYAENLRKILDEI